MSKRAALLMLLPAIGFFLLSFVIPMVLVGRLSFYRSDYMTEQFVLLDNYINAFKDHYFIKSFENAFWFVLMIAPPIIIGAYWIASFLSGFSEKVQSIGRFVIYIPGLASGLIMALLWDWMLHRQGLVNQLLSYLGVAAIPWLSQPWTARISIAVITVISSVGGLVILFAASMHSLPKELKDAARIDGANERQYKRHIVLPLMIPTVMLAILLEIVGIMQMFETMFVLTGEGGPEGSTASPVYEIFLTAFRFGKSGLAAAKGIILMVVIAIILIVKQRIEKWSK
jgi:ABC-type sugar transport system permease subunit